MWRLSNRQPAPAGGAGNHRPAAEGSTPITSGGVASTIDLMGLGRQLAMPSLDGVPLEHRFSAGDQAAVALARTLLKLDVAEPGDWAIAGHDPTAYVLATVDRWIRRHGGHALRRRFDLSATLTGCLDEHSERKDANPDGSHLYLTVDPNQAGFVVLDPTLELLEGAHPRLPATFYALFASALNSWVRVYDYRDAQDRVSMLREWVEGEPDEEQYEIPDVESCLPTCMKRRPLSRRRLRELRPHLKGRQVRTLMHAVLKLAEISRGAKRPQLTEEMREELMDSNPPLPSLLAAFAESDAITGCFENDGENMMEVMPEPSLIIPLNAHETGSVRQAFHTFGVLCNTLAAASRLIDQMPGNERWVIEQ